MAFASRYEGQQEPSRSEIDAQLGWQLLEFGVDWCPHCQGAQPSVKTWVDEHALEHMKVEDGKGRPLGRSFTVKLWPTLILLHDGEEQARVVRPQRVEDFAAFDALLDQAPRAP
jgi:thioredoxin 1